jgi:hypothetical protein
LVDETHHLLAYADGVNLLRDGIENIKRNSNTLIEDIKEVGLKVNEDKT